MRYDLTCLLESSEKSITQMVTLLDDAPSLCLNTLEAENTALIIVDMVNGFVKEGQCLPLVYSQLFNLFVIY